MIKKFESLTMPPDKVADTLTDLCNDCSELIVHNVMPALTQLQQQVLLVLIEVHFTTVEQEEKFDNKVRPKSVLLK